jgi:hypothetical protein
VEGKKQYHVKISNRCASLENLNDKRDINRAGKDIKRVIIFGRVGRLSSVEAM